MTNGPNYRDGHGKFRWQCGLAQRHLPPFVPYAAASVICHFRNLEPAAAPPGAAAGFSASPLRPLPSWFEQLRAVAHIIFQFECVLRLIIKARDVTLHARAEQ